MIKILIADDHPIVRVGIKRIIEDAPDMQCVAEVDNGDDVLIKIREHDIDLLLLDISNLNYSSLLTIDNLLSIRRIF